MKLTALEKKGLLEKFPTKSVTFKIIEGAEELVEQEEDFTKKGVNNTNLAKAKKKKMTSFILVLKTLRLKLVSIKNVLKTRLYI